MSKKLVYGLISVTVFNIIIALLTIKADAEYDRFKVVGVDKLKNNYDITIIQDKETGCLYMRSIETYVIETQPILNEGGNPDCRFSK